MEKLAKFSLIRLKNCVVSNILQLKDAQLYTITYTERRSSDIKDYHLQNSRVRNREDTFFSQVCISVWYHLKFSAGLSNYPMRRTLCCTFVWCYFFFCMHVCGHYTERECSSGSKKKVSGLEKKGRCVCVCVFICMCKEIWWCLHTLMGWKMKSRKVES